jgi:outer membrane protein assembly factor BamE (lipoprotein component of BamABCDE complex)
MGKVKKWIIGIVAVPVLALVCLWLLFFALDVATGSYTFRHSFKQIEPGYSKDQVLKRLGSPLEESKEFYVGQFIFYETPSPEIYRSKSNYYSIWLSPGISDEIYAVGFDSENKVTGIAYGST